MGLCPHISYKFFNILLSNCCISKTIYQKYNEKYRYNINLGSNIKSGVVIVKLENGYSAEKSGLKVGDVITKFDDNKVTNVSTLRYYLYEHKTGDTIKVTYIRDGKEGTIKLTLD